MTALAGRRILVVEDEALLAAMLAELLEEGGAVVVGPAATVRAALALAEEGRIDLGLLDVNLRGESIGPIASLLHARGTPIVFATGYGSRPAGPWSDAPMLGKPFSEAELFRAVGQALGAGTP